MLDSHSIRRAAAQLGGAAATSLRWRHRFLALSKDDRPQFLSGIAEADEMYVLESHKGSRTLGLAPRKRGGKATKRGISHEQMCILVARDRTGQTLDWVPGKGPVTSTQLHDHLEARLQSDVLLVTDAHGAYRAFAREAGISHEAVNVKAGTRVRGAIHVQNVNAYHSRLRRWLLPFRGVASRYLGKTSAGAGRSTAAGSRRRTPCCKRPGRVVARKENPLPQPRAGTDLYGTIQRTRA